jgi:D-arabinose 1-dehydrogenase-like Zn-dependent alcohol dehydrogenase
MFTPMKKFGVGKGTRIGNTGIGGLGPHNNSVRGRVGR